MPSKVTTLIPQRSLDAGILRRRLELAKSGPLATVHIAFCFSSNIFCLTWTPAHFLSTHPTQRGDRQKHESRGKSADKKVTAVQNLFGGVLTHC